MGTADPAEVTGTEAKLVVAKPMMVEALAEGTVVTFRTSNPVATV